MNPDDDQEAQNSMTVDGDDQCRIAEAVASTSSTAAPIIVATTVSPTTNGTTNASPLTDNSPVVSNTPIASTSSPPSTSQTHSNDHGASTSNGHHHHTNVAESGAAAAVVDDATKRNVAKKLIERYFYQLSDGCGNPKCSNRNCASSGGVATLSPNQAAARAIQLYTQEAELCELHPAKATTTGTTTGTSIAGPSGDIDMDMDASDGCATASSSLKSSGAAYANCRPSSATRHTGTTAQALANALSNTANTSAYSQPPKSPSAPLTPGTPIDDFLDESTLNALIDDYTGTRCARPLTRTLGRIFSSRKSLAASFQKRAPTHIDALLERAPADLKSLKKEDLRSLEGDLDKDEDDSAEAAAATAIAAEQQPPPNTDPFHTNIDLVALRRCLQRLYDTHVPAFEALNQTLHGLALHLHQQLDLDDLFAERDDCGEMVTVFLIVFETIAIGSAEFMDLALPSVCKAASHLSTAAQAKLARIWSRHCTVTLKPLLQALQQLISLQVIAGSDSPHFYVQDIEEVVDATRVMKIIYYANLLAGQLEAQKMSETADADDAARAIAASLDADGLAAIPEDDEFFYYNGQRAMSVAIAAQVENALAGELGVNVLDSRQPFMPFEEFYNEPLSDAIEMDNDYLNYKNRRMDAGKFSFMLYSFILTPATKTLALYYDNRIRMYSERRLSILHTEYGGQPPNPYLKLKVRREQIIDDALVGLEMVAMGNPKDLKKQLVVEFVGEQGIDEGGVSKEFFQLVVEQIFNADYGMFVQPEGARTVWFNATSFENEAQFTLIGIVLGLAIYNNIILAVNFPMVVYRKLMGCHGSFADLADWSPELHRSLSAVLEYEGGDMEEVFMLTFRISYADVFGSVLTHDLKPAGDTIAVCQENKQEFIDLYSDYLLNTSVEKQFRAFRRGFQMVTDESPLHLLFRPEEIELLVCGSKQFDFNELEKATEYEGGFTSKSQTIVDFWTLVHALPMESKKKLLEFTTGSDRVPVGGLSRLKLVIARNGPDSDRLPTSHTCFNVLLLPEYTDKQKLEDRLLKAINYSKGFGML